MRQGESGKNDKNVLIIDSEFDIMKKSLTAHESTYLSQELGRILLPKKIS